jgi:hypothetical protein
VASLLENRFWWVETIVMQKDPNYLYFRIYEDIGREAETKSRIADARRSIQATSALLDKFLTECGCWDLPHFLIPTCIKSDCHNFSSAQTSHSMGSRIYSGLRGNWNMLCNYMELFRIQANQIILIWNPMFVRRLNVFLRLCVEAEETRFTEGWVEGKKMSFAEASSLALKIMEEK